MAEHNELGKRGETIALQFLREKQYHILETNWRYKKAELDIIAKEKETLVFVEVKTRSSDFFAPPEAAVTPKKEQLMSAAAIAYMRKTGHEWAIRFDIIAIVIKGIDRCEIQHIEDAFFPS